MQLKIQRRYEFFKNWDKNFNFWVKIGPLTDIYREREREGETNRIFEVNGFEFYEVF